MRRYHASLTGIVISLSLCASAEDQSNLSSYYLYKVTGDGNGNGNGAL